MLRLRAFIALSVTCALPLVSASSARAQGGADGSIIGYVFDQAGNPLAGIAITASSPTQIGGAKKAYTDAEGAFRIRQLFPGTFQVSASAPKLKTYVQKDLKVGITAATELNIVMEVQTGAVEEVRVVEKAPTVSTTTTNVKEVYDLDFVESMPFNSRDQVFNQMVNQIGGAVGGRIRGGANNQTIMTQDGFDMRDQYPVTKASAAYEIQSAGYGADNATAAGGVVNLVTKTGSNKWEFEFNATAENDFMRFGKDARDNPGNFYYLANPAVAGPIIRDKLWFAATFETHYLGRSREADAEGIFEAPKPHLKGINKGTLKVTWQMTPRNKLTFLNNVDSAWNTNMKNELGVEQESQINRKAGLSGLWGLIWESLLTDDLVFRSQAAFSKRPQYWYPWRCEDGKLGECDVIPGAIVTSPRRTEINGTAVGCDGTGECSGGSVVPHRRDDLYVYQTFNRLQYFVDNKALGGEHSFVLKHQFYIEEEVRKRAQPGDYYLEYAAPGVPQYRYDFYSNDPRFEEEHRGWWIGQNTLTRQVAALSDSWRPTRHLTITPAISWAWAYGNHLRSDSRVMDSKAWAPSATAAWDATHDGRTVIRGGYSQYVDVAIRGSIIHTLGDQVRKRCTYNQDSGLYDTACEYSGGAGRNTVGLPCGPTGLNVDGTPCREKLRIPRTFEYTLGAEREVVQGLALSVDAVYRRFKNQYETRETNRVWDTAGQRVIGYRNGRPETVVDLGTPDAATRYYRGITAGFNKREGRGRLYVSYTISQLRGNVYNGANNPWGDIPGRDVYLDGPLPDDRLHDFKVSGTYSATNFLSLGVRYNFFSGHPYQRLFRNDATGGFDNYRATRGTDPGNNLNDPADDRALRLPPQQELNVQARLNLAPFIGHKVSIAADLLNVLNLRTVTAYGANNGQNFGVETGWMAPFRARLQLDYKY